MGSFQAQLSLARPPGAAQPDQARRAAGLTRRAFVALTSGIAGLVAAGPAGVARADHVPDTPTPKRPPPEENKTFSPPEVELTFRNYGMPAEMLREPITPLGLHYLLIHFDVPRLDPDTYRVTIGGRVNNPMVLTLDDIKARDNVTQPVIMECAGTGRSTMHPRAIYVPWLEQAIGNYEWTGTPLGPILDEAGLLSDAVEVLFTGFDEGIDLGVEHAFERSLPVEQAMADGVMLAWEANGQPLLPQHGFPLRLLVPTWYGMASVKWLRAITVLREPFKGVEQAKVYRYQQTADEPGEPVTTKRVHSVLMPPGIPDLITRYRFVSPGPQTLQGMAWSAGIPITRVEVSTDGAQTWTDAELLPAVGPFSWTPFRSVWQATTPGEYELAVRATDAGGNVQPVDPNAVWNRQGMGGNGVQRLRVRVQEGIGTASSTVPSTPRIVVDGADSVPRPTP